MVIYALPRYWSMATAIPVCMPSEVPSMLPHNLHVVTDVAFLACAPAIMYNNAEDKVQ